MTEPAEPIEVEIEVAGHRVTVKAADPLSDVAAMALALFRSTADDAKRAPIGFGAGGGQVELGPPEE